MVGLASQFEKSIKPKSPQFLNPIILKALVFVGFFDTKDDSAPFIVGFKINPTKIGASMTLDSRQLVDMPKSGVVICHIKNYHPVYMSVSGSGHQNAQGTPTKDRVR
jgi:hypothetical protein